MRVIAGLLPPTAGKLTLRGKVVDRPSSALGSRNSQKTCSRPAWSVRSRSRASGSTALNPVTVFTRTGK
ncbi:MAG: hypothetical protein ABSC37_16175 [Xanthobacteraceae bacterium]